MPNNRPRRNLLLLASTGARLGLAGVFLVAGLAKISDPIGSANAVRAYRVLPDDLAALTGYLLPAAEVLIGVALLAGVYTRITAVASAALLLVFTVGVAQAWARGLAIDCGCFGGGGATDRVDPVEYASTIGRDLALLAVAAWLTRHPTSRFALKDRPTTLTDTAEDPDE